MNAEALERLNVLLDVLEEVVATAAAGLEHGIAPDESTIGDARLKIIELFKALTPPES